MSDPEAMKTQWIEAENAALAVYSEYQRLKGKADALRDQFDARFKRR